MDTTVTPELMADLGSGASTPSFYWIVKRKDGLAFGRTTHIAKQFIVTKIPEVPPILGQLTGAVECKPVIGFDASDIDFTDALSQDNLDITVLMDASDFDEKSIRAGLWNDAAFEIGVMNYRAPAHGTKTLIMGTLGSFSGGDQVVQIEQRGLTQALEANMDGIVGPMCRVPVFSQGVRKCNLDPTPFIRTGTISSSVADRQFTDAARTEPDGYWTDGLVRFSSGDSAGFTFVIESSTAEGVFVLSDEAFLGLADGDEYDSMTPGCNKLLKILQPDGTYLYTGDCKTKFDNVDNMQAEPEVPGQTAIQKYGGQTVAPATS